ncbi:MAG: hypothetical protein AB8B63_12370 [Granulosicoccus sp.]
MSILLPRLPRQVTDPLLAELEVCAAQSDAIRPMQLPPEVTYTESGGSRVGTQALRELCDGIRGIATDCGWPEADTVVARARFDAQAAAWLAVHPLLQSGEALRDDVWACLAICLLPDVALWRFDFSPARLLGGVRNTFQRLWIRGNALDRGEHSDEPRWYLLETLSEDALVAITERPSIAADRQLALALAEGWVRCSAVFGSSVMESVMRRVILKVRMRAETELFCVLPPLELAQLIDREFALAGSRDKR